LRIKKKWGEIRQLAFNQPCSVKVIQINPGQSTSYHYHNFREDLWYILDDGVGVIIDGKEYRAKAGDEFYIPAGKPHRLFSFAEKVVRILEIAYGFHEETDKVIIDE
jgi:mannose-1-phosphate guanylyltransferase